MIIDKLSNAKLYDGVHPRLKKGLDFLVETDLNSLAVGTYQVEEDKVFVMIQEYETKVAEQCRFEAHYQYADIQYVIQGAEKMGYTNIEETKVEEEHKDKDLMFLEATGEESSCKRRIFCCFHTARCS